MKISKLKFAVPVVAFALALCSAFAGCETRDAKTVHAEASPTAKSAGFTVERVRNDMNYTVAFVITEDATGKRYLMNSEGGAPIDMGASK